MNFLTIIAIVAALIYILSPYDLLPDIFPVTGWFDDAFLLGVLIYYLKYRKLPNFISRLIGAGTRKAHFRHSEKFDHSGDKETDGGSKQMDPYEVLGLKAGASPEEIRAAYRQAAQAYHPDKVSHLGPELRTLAQQKFLEIQKAYDRLMGKNN